MKQSEKYFVTGILHWNEMENRRNMPWKGEKDPYKIWLSEIILQQTRVEQGLNYYNRFIATFPTIQLLAKASETKVFKLWEGLGYYTRCKNLIATAKFITEKYDGKFPDDYKKIVELKGIGPYTAAAIASFAFDLPYAVVDGNVFRILSRFFGIDKAIDSSAGKKIFTTLASNLIDKKQPGTYNQAIMDFGAIICKPKPLCSYCILQNSCVAYITGVVDKLPVKEKSIIKKVRWFYYLVIEYNDKVYVRKRLSKDIWENLYEFALLEFPAAVDLKFLQQQPIIKKMFKKIEFEIIKISKLYRQQLTHQTIHGQFIQIKITKPLQLAEYKAVTYKQLKRLPFPKFIADYLSENN